MRPSVPSSWLKKPYTLFDDMTAISGWAAGTNTGISVDLANTVTGASSIKITTSAPSGGTYCAVDKNVVNFNFYGLTKAMMLKVYVPDPTTISQLIFYLGSSAGGWTKYWSFSFQGVALKAGWNYLAAYPSEGTYVGGFAFTDQIIKARITVVQASTASASVTVDSIWIDGKSDPKLIITFDDSWKTVYDNALPIMKQYGIRGTMYAIPSFLSDSGLPSAAAVYSTKAHLQEMQDNGWCVANHTWNHAYFLSDNYSIPDYLNKVSLARDWLRTNGFGKGAEHLAYPRGEYSPALADALKAMGMRTARSTYTSSVANPPTVESFFQMNVRGFGNSTTLSLAQKWIDYAVENGGFTFLMFHQIPIDDTNVSDGVTQAGLAWSSSKFASLMNYIKERKVDCITIDEWYEGMTKNSRPFIPR